MMTIKEKSMKKLDPNFKVCITPILNIAPHPNPVVSRLEIATVYGFEVVVGKGNYTVGQKVVYFPVNSVLPGLIENHLFAPDAKIKLTKSRIRACRIQKFVSQGMIAPWDEIQKVCNLPDFPIEQDLQEELQVVKYYPPSVILQNVAKEAKVRNKPLTNQYFKEYNGCVNIKWEPHAFTPDNIVWISEKIHGSNWRAGYLPFTPSPIVGLNFGALKKIKTIKNFFKSISPAVSSVWEKVKHKLHLTPEFEFCYGSNTVQRQKKSNSPTWYGADIYAEMCHRFDLKNKLKDFPGYVLYGEIYGPDIQKGYHYGLSSGQKGLVIFDVMYQAKGNQVWLSLEEAQTFCSNLGLNFVPVLYQGLWNKEVAESFVGGNSVFAPSQKVREGVVVKNDDLLTLNRKKIKIINPEYAMKEANDETTDHQEIEGNVELPFDPTDDADYML